MQRFSFTAGLKGKNEKKVSRYCTLDDPGVNRRLSSDIPQGASDDEIELHRVLSRLPKRLRDLL